MIRKDMLSIYSAAVSAVEGEHVVAMSLPVILENQLTLEEKKQLQIVSIGKAADAMLQGALSCFSENTTPRSLLITKQGHCSLQSIKNDHIECIESAHPVPNEESLLAGQRLIDFLKANQSPCLFLISGGTSSLVEVLAENWSLTELQELTEWMLANAYNIGQINAVRSRVSLIKAGGLWPILENRKVICLMISDVPDNDPSVIGSGLLFPADLNQTVTSSLPDKWLEKLPNQKVYQVTDSFYWQIVATNIQARKTAADKARKLGYKAITFDQLLQSDAVEAAKYCIQLAKKHSHCLLIWGAETTVVLPEQAGKGGRNQHFALAAAIEMKGENKYYVLSAGTDGTDGMTNDAGAIVDGQTIERAEQEGFSARHSLLEADSGHFLSASGDLLSTGVTGTNVMDLIIIYYAGKH